MKYLWIGPGLGERSRKEVLTKGGKLLSAYVSQTNLVEGLDSLGIDMDTLNGPKMDEKIFPVVKQEIWSRNEQSIDYFVGYRNIKYLNRITKENALCKAVDDWLVTQDKDKLITVIIYNMHTAFISAACRVKAKHNKTRIILIIPDLPQFMDYKKSIVKSALKELDWIRIKSYLPQIDKYVLYSAHMAEYLQLKDDRWIVMEGSYDSEIIGKPVEQDTGIVSVMYSGILDMRYGIPELLDAMELLDNHFELWLTGDGNAKPLIESRAMTDLRIKYFGYLPSRVDLLNKQASATMLISPRRDTEEASKYCFPSKLLEYMVSGKPVISCFLAGFPEEYYKYLIELKSSTPHDIAKTIKKVGAMSSENRDELGLAAKKFVLLQKNKYKQAEKILSFICN